MTDKGNITAIDGGNTPNVTRRYAMSIIIPRKDYLANRVTHQAYYGQPAFQTPEVRAAVLNAIGLYNIRKSTDEHFNDIPLSMWDRLNHPIIRLVGEAIKEANQPGPGEVTGISLSDVTCIAKQAAHSLKEGLDSSTKKD